ncbi:hypothetical protein M422DRAFT_786448 [Sphaerobolus stellatus SS14]|uniref:Uncharacterized protein n=1 Tax=Sphaerobolus stellatus (strain SS14) TaxID=990650 RepID=A0A0C9U085_SPHS4|nr:hypothetical protein M422DRAFT_786448 [Sphaerobolus stellatus SS14]
MAGRKDLGKKEKESYNETKNEKKNITILGDEHRGIILLERERTKEKITTKRTTAEEI